LQYSLYGEKKIPEMTGSFDNEANTQQIKNQKWSIDRRKA
jgi:hypothetical protein